MPAPAMVNHMPLVRELCGKLTETHLAHLDKERMRRSEDQFFLDYVDHQAQWTGSKRMERIIDMCNNVPGYYLSPFQKLCLREGLQCFAPLIFGNPPANELALLLKRYGLTAPKTKMLFIGTSRRGGKTDILTLLAAAILLNVPFVKLLYFSIFDHTCEVACNTVYQWICDLGFRHLVLRKSKKKLVLKGDTPEDTRYIMFINGQSPDVRFC
jgi:hypothetical protein